MIRNFASKLAQDLYDGINSRHTRKLANELHGRTERVLDQLSTASNVETLRIPPSNRLEKLTGNRQGYWSIRINKQWRVIFKWDKTDTVEKILWITINLETNMLPKNRKPTHQDKCWKSS